MTSPKSVNPTNLSVGQLKTNPNFILISSNNSDTFFWCSRKVLNLISLINSLMKSYLYPVDMLVEAVCFSKVLLWGNFKNPLLRKSSYVPKLQNSQVIIYIIKTDKTVYGASISRSFHNGHLILKHFSFLLYLPLKQWIPVFNYIPKHSIKILSYFLKNGLFYMQSLI